VKRKERCSESKSLRKEGRKKTLERKTEKEERRVYRKKERT
jgi:hypothetical protein